MRSWWIGAALAGLVLAGWGGYVVFFEKSLEDRLRADGYVLAFEHQGERVWLHEHHTEAEGGTTLLTARVVGRTDACYSTVPLADPVVAARQDYSAVCDGGSMEADAAFFLVLVPRDAVAAEYVHQDDYLEAADDEELEPVELGGGIPLTVYDPRPEWPVKLAAGVVHAQGGEGTGQLALGTVLVGRHG